VNQRLLIYAALAIGVVAVSLLGDMLLVSIVSAGVAAIVAIFVHRRLGSSDGREESGEQPAADPADEWIDHLRSLAELNLAIRERALPQDVTVVLETNIDVLRRLVPELNGDYVGSDLTWTVNRMARDYLPRIVRPYLELSPVGRDEHRAELLKSLAGLESELENIAALLRDAKVGEFKTKAAFLRARFLEGGLG